VGRSAHFLAALSLASVLTAPVSAQNQTEWRFAPGARVVEFIGNVPSGTLHIDTGSITGGPDYPSADFRVQATDGRGGWVILQFDCQGARFRFMRSGQEGGQTVRTPKTDWEPVIRGRDGAVTMGELTLARLCRTPDAPRSPQV